MHGWIGKRTFHLIVLGGKGGQDAVGVGLIGHVLSPSAPAIAT
jgi:hypothetical protein